MAVALVVVVTAAACSRSPGRARGPLFPCESAEEQAGLIAERLTHGATELHRPQAVRLDPPVGQYVYVVAAEVQGPEGEGEVATWGVGPWLGGARIMGIDDAARRWSDWGTAIDAKSPAGKQRGQLAARPEVAAARACVS